MGEKTQQAKAKADQAEEHAQRAGGEVQRHPAYQVLVTVGLICYGLIHFVMAWMAGQIILGGSGGKDDSPKGALADLVSKPFGNVLMIIFGIGLLAMAVWQAIEAAVGYRWLDDKKRTFKRLASVGRLAVYAALGSTALSLAFGAKAQSTDASAKDATAKLMSAPGGQFLVGIVGAIVVAVGVSQIVKGVRRTFVEDDLDGSVPDWAAWLGTIGWCAKGVSLGLAGALIIWSAIRFDPQQAAGIDGALRTLAGQPFGAVLLAIIALGFVAFGAYCLVWSRNARHSND